MNLSQQKREKLISALKEMKQDLNLDEKYLIALNEIENELNGKKYGLVWEEHEEAVDAQMIEAVPIFVEDKTREIICDEDKPYNFLLEGDNLHSLYLLKKTHKGKIDIIYIDPPYNTGNKDFIYDDVYVDREDSYVHSKWISFMYRRLLVASELLTKDGVIFISIDNNEYANLKILCDEVFGSNTYITTIHVELSATQGMKIKAAKDGNIVKNGEYILVYTRDGHRNVFTRPLTDSVKYDNHYSLFLLSDKDNSTYTEKPINEVIMNNTEIIQELSVLKLLNKNGKLSNDKISEAYDKSETFRNWCDSNSKRICRIHDTIQVNDDFGRNMVEGKIYTYNDGNREYLVVKKDGEYKQRILLSDKLAFSDDFYHIYGPTRIRGDWWAGFYLDMGNVGKEGGISFTNGKKPIRLIKQLVSAVGNKNSIVLDFFAGSGTTAEAVAVLNNIDGGSRRVILCTNNEIDNDDEIKYLYEKGIIPKPPTKKQGTNYENWKEIYESFTKTEIYNQIIKTNEYQMLGIAKSKTYKRIQNIVNGYNSKQAIKTNFKYFNTSFVSKTSKNLSKELIKHVKELIELEWGVSIDKKVNLMVMTEDELDKIEVNWDKLKTTVKSIYRARQVVYTSKQKQLFKCINNFIIPDYYFDNELKEVGENW